MTSPRVPVHNHSGFLQGGKLELSRVLDAGEASSVVGGSTSSAAVVVEEDGAVVVASASAVNAGHGLDATDEGGGVAGLAVDETELNGALIPGIVAGANAELNIEGGQDIIKAHGSMGATETFDPTDGNVHTGTLDANCTFTLNVPTGSGACTLEFWLTEDGTGGWTVTWPGSVTEQGTHDTTASTTQRVIVETIDGGTTWIATWIGGGIASSSFAIPAIVLGTAAAAGAATTAIRSDSTIVAFDATAPTTSAIGDAAATGSVAKAARRDHIHGREALSTATPLVESGSGAVGTGTKSSREDHVHPAASGTVGVGTYGLLVEDGVTAPPVTLYTEDGTDWIYADG